MFGYKLAIAYLILFISLILGFIFLIFLILGLVCLILGFPHIKRPADEPSCKVFGQPNQNREQSRTENSDRWRPFQKTNCSIYRKYRKPKLHNPGV